MWFNDSTFTMTQIPLHFTSAICGFHFGHNKCELTMENMLDMWINSGGKPVTLLKMPWKGSHEPVNTKIHWKVKQIGRPWCSGVNDLWNGRWSYWACKLACPWVDWALLYYVVGMARALRVSPPRNCKQLLYVRIELLFNDHCPHAQTS
jgi:hypothetical protein